MAKCSLDIKKDIIDTAGDMLVQRGANVTGDAGFFPNPSKASKAISEVNTSFKDLVVKEGEKGSFVIDPSDKLVNTYFEKYKELEEAKLLKEATLLQEEERKRGGYTEEDRGEFFQLTTQETMTNTAIIESISNKVRLFNTHFRRNDSDNIIKQRLTELGLNQFEINYLEALDRKSNTPRENFSVLLAKEYSSYLQDNVLETRLAKLKMMEANDELDKMLLDFLKPLGITLKEVDNIKERFGADAFGVADILNRVIYAVKNRKLDTIAEELGHFYVELIGIKDTASLGTRLMSKIEQWSGYNKVFAAYQNIYKNRDGKPDVVKIKKEAAAQAIAEAILKKYASKSESIPKAERDFWNLVLDLINKISQFFKNSPNFKPIEVLADEIATKVFNKDYSDIVDRIESVKKKNTELKTYEGTLSNIPFVKDVVDRIMALGGVLTGSLAIRAQGELYRDINEKIHDLDFGVDYQYHKGDWRTFIENFKKEFPNYYPITEKPFGGNSGELVMNGIITNDPALFEKFKNLSGDFNTRLDQFTLEEQDKLLLIDFFFYPEGSVTPRVNGFESAGSIFNAKSFMGMRAKDAFDLLNYIPYKAPEEKLSEYSYLQKEKESERASNEQLNSKIKKFLSSIGVSVEALNEIRDREGNKLDAIAKADMLNMIIQVVNNEADITTLPEEAAHFFVEMLGVNHPLYKDMYSKITSYALYSDVVAKYKDSPLYRNPDGTINFDKLKKEAIGKLIAQHIVEKFDEEETTKRVEAAKSWWKKVWEALLKIFAKGEKINDKVDNPFRAAAQKVMDADVSDLNLEFRSEQEYLQLNNLAETNFNKAVALRNEITLDDDIDPKTGKKKHIYQKNGKPIVDADGTPRSVNENVVKPWYKKKFPTDKRSDVQKVIDDLKAEYGVGLHKDIEKIINRYVDPATGLVRAASIPGDKLEVNAEVERKLDNYLKALVRSYPTGTRFLAESRIYNSKKNLPGTVDLLVFLPDGSADIYDWKSQEVRDGETELKWFKEPAYRLQLEEYRQAIEQQFGITKFNKIRAIPIRTDFKVAKVSGAWVPQNLKDIEIGPLDPSLIPENKEYLLPVVAEKESTGDQKLDKLIERLYIIYETLANKSTKDKDKKNIELNKLKKTIRNLQVKKDLKNFVDSGLIEVNKYYDKYNNNDIDISEILEAKDIINVYSEGSVYLRNLLIDLRMRISKEQDSEEKRKLEKIQDDFKTMALNAKDLVELLNERAKELADAEAQKNGIKGLLSAERAMDFLKRNFRALSQLETAAAQVFYKIRNKAFQVRDLEVESINEKLAELKSNLEKWASSKGISTNNLFDGILDIDAEGNKTGDFLKIYSDEFIKLKNQAIKRGDATWIRDNTIFDSKAYLKAFKKYKELVEGTTYSADPKLDREKKDAAIIKWVELHNGEKSPVAALLPKGNFLKPKDIWWSEKYKNLNKAENAPLNAVYNEFQKMLRDSEKAGMIDYEFGFIPSIIKTKMESFVLGDMGKAFDKQSFLQSLTVDSSQEFGQLDINGKQIKKIPVYYTKELGADKSFDLFKVFSIWGTHTSNYKAMSSIEDSANLILYVEQNKQSLQTNRFGKVKKGAEPVNNNQINADVLEKFVNFYVYGQKMDAADDFTFKIAGKEISATRGLQSLLRYFSIKTLALNPISGTANLVGGTVNASFVAKKNIYFGDGDWGWGQYAMTSRDEKALAFLDYAGVDLEDKSFFNSNQLSVSDTLKNWTSDKFFIIQRTGDKLVTYPVALAMYRTHMVDENGQIVSIREYIKAKNNYETIYNLPSADRKALMKKIDAEIEEYTEKNSLYAKSKIVNNKLEIEGVDRKSDTFVEFRNKIKKVNKTILGNSTSEDINQFRIGMLGQVMMQFRSWIPGLVIERFGDLAYDTDLETYNYGKARVFFKHFFTEKWAPLLGELITGFGDNAIERAKQRYQEMIIRKAEQGDLNFKDRMSEAEFVDMYIGNLRSMMRELLVMIAFLSLAIWAHTAPPDEDEDAKGVRKLLAKAMDKYYNEVAFFYNPNEFQSLIKSPVPITGLFTDLYNLGENTMTELWGLGTENKKLIDESHPMKYFNKLVPVVRQAQDIFALFNDDFRKSWGIKI
jgi:hypothetical protein